MSYQEFAKPKGSYQGNKPAKEQEYIAPTQPKPLSYGKEGEFTVKNIYDGVGAFHANHFRGYFSYISNPSNNQILAMNTHFFDNFCAIFSVSNVANATLSKYKIDSKSTVEFKIGGTVNELKDFYSWLPNLDMATGKYHSDWVSLEKESDNLSCFASTLKREWVTQKEQELITDIVKKARQLGITSLTQAELTEKLIEVNQHHFLAGRRSWVIGYDESINLWFIETVAYERNSMPEYSMADKYGGLRDTVINLWINQVNNYFSILEKKSGIKTSISGVPARVNGLVINKFADYNYNRNVLYKVAEENVSTDLLNIPWFADCLIRHTGLIKGL